MNSQNTYTVTMLGCGKMGSAILTSWLEKDLTSAVTAIDPNTLDFNDPRVTHHTSADIEIHSDILVLAVKPQMLQDAAQALNDNVAEHTVIMSIAAGKSLNSLEALFKPDQPVVRVMPNTPAAIGQGANVAIANNNVTEDQKQAVSDLLAATGTVHWIEDESLMDSVTALSGSGPAYIFYLIEMLAQSGEKLGLDADMAMELARQTVIGSAALAAADENSEASTLRKNVTSPGGTTEAALNVLMDGRAQKIFDEALTAAKKRGEELNA